MKNIRLACLLVAALIVSFPFWVCNRLCGSEDLSSVEQIKPALPSIPQRVFSVKDFNGIGDGKTLNSRAFAEAIAAIEKAGGGKLVVPRGVYVTVPFTLCSNLELHLEEGAMIQAPTSFEALGLPEPTTLQSQAEVALKVKTPEPLINGKNLHDVAITGPGTIDGSGAHWWTWSERAARAQPGRLVYRRPHLIVITQCDRLLIADVTLLNSSMFHLVPTSVTDLTIERVKIRAPENAPNTDAIDPGLVTRAVIRDCEIDTGDDDIAVKSGATDLLIENCTIKHGHGISIGSQTTAGIHNMLVRHCTFDGTANGVRIKSMRGAGGVVENVRYTDLQMENVSNAIVLDMNYVDNNRPNFKGDPTKIPDFHHIVIDHLKCVNALHAGKIVGLPDSAIREIILRDVEIAAENDFIITDAEKIVFDHVTLSIKGHSAVSQAANPPKSALR